MDKLVRSISGTLLMLLAAGTAHSGGEKDLRSVIDRAIQVQGADKQAGKNHGTTMKGTGTFYGLGEGIPFTGEWYFHGQNQSRVGLEIKVMDQTLKFVQVMNGTKGWTKLNDEVKDTPVDELREEMADNYVRWLSALVPLKDAAFQLAPLGEVKIGGKAAVGVRVSHKGQRDVSLFFDRASGFLVKNECRIKDVKGGGDKELNQEIFMAQYKDFMGTKHPTKITIKRDGNQFVEAEMTDIRVLETIDETIFAKP